MPERQFEVNALVEIQLRRTSILKDISDLGAKLAAKHEELGVVAKEFQIQAREIPSARFSPKGVVQGFQDAS